MKIFSEIFIIFFIILIIIFILNIFDTKTIREAAFHVTQLSFNVLSMRQTNSAGSSIV